MLFRRISLAILFSSALVKATPRVAGLLIRPWICLTRVSINGTLYLPMRDIKQLSTEMILST